MATAVNQNSSNAVNLAIDDELTDTMNVTAGSNRIVIVILNTFKKTSAPPDITGNATFDGTAMTLFNSVSFSEPLSVYKFGRIFAYYMLETDLTQGSAFVVLANFASNFDFGYVSSFQYKDAFQGAPLHFSNTRLNNGFGPTNLRIDDTQVSAPICGSQILIKNGTTDAGEPREAFTGEIGEGFFSSSGDLIAPYSTSPTHDFRQRGISGTSIDGISRGVMSHDNSINATPILCDLVFFAVEISNDDFVASAAGVDGLASGAFCEYVEDGQVRKMVTSVSGLAHLEGESIEIQMDGILPTDSNKKLVTNAFTVSGGAITLPKLAAVVHAGLPYDGTLTMLKQSGGSAIGSGQTKMRRTYLAVVRFFKSLGLKVGPDEDNLSPIFPVTPALPLISSDKRKLPKAQWDNETEMVFKMEDPLPCLILSILLESEVEEKG